mgnify:FL=1
MWPTLRASDNSSTIQSNIDTGDRLIVTLQLIFQLESIPCSSVELDTCVSCHGQGLLICGEGVVGDWVMEQGVNFWSSHIEDVGVIDRRSSLLSILELWYVDDEAAGCNFVRRMVG